MRNFSYENDFDLRKHKHVGGTDFHMDCFEMPARAMLPNSKNILNVIIQSMRALLNKVTFYIRLL